MMCFSVKKCIKECYAGCPVQALSGAVASDMACDAQTSTPNTMTPSSTRKSGWGRTKTKKSRLSTAECTSIVEGLKVIYFGKVRAHTICCVLLMAMSGCMVVVRCVSFRSFGM